MGLRLTAPVCDLSRRDFRPRSSPTSSDCIGRGTLGNVVASGTEIIERLGAEHVSTGKPIVYTPADSVFQVAAHEDVIPIAEQYRICEQAFDLVRTPRRRPRHRAAVRGPPGSFRRTARRHDYALDAVRPTLLDALTAAGHQVVSIGKVTICSPVAVSPGPGRRRAMPTGWRGCRPRTTRRVDSSSRTSWTPTPSTATATTRPDTLAISSAIDRWLGGGAARPAWTICSSSPPITATIRPPRARTIRASTCRWSRRPACARAGRHRHPQTFADLGQTIAENFGVGPLAHGMSFLEAIVSTIRESLEPREASNAGAQAAGAPARAAGSVPSPRTTSARRFSTIATA